VVALRHTEHVVVPGKRLGMRPRDTSRPLLKLADYLTGRVPDHPPRVDYFTRIPSWCLGRNTEFGTCGPTSFANLVLLVSTWLADAPIKPTDDQIIDLYRRSGNPDFDPATGLGDNGVDMTVMLAAAVKAGIGGLRPLAFAAVNGQDPDEVWAASSLFGATLWGCDLTQSHADAAVWDDVAGDPPWGGHAVLAAGRYDDQAGTLNDGTWLVSWADAGFVATDTFIQHRVPERYVVIFDWHLRSRTFLDGVNLTTMAADYTALTGRPFPGQLPPSPAPTPSPATNPDQSLMAALDPWAKRWPASTPKTAYRTWKQAKGYNTP
jgi:hypothetical protein